MRARAATARRRRGRSLRYGCPSWIVDRCAFHSAVSPAIMPLYGNSRKYQRVGIGQPCVAEHRLQAHDRSGHRYLGPEFRCDEGCGRCAASLVPDRCSLSFVRPYPCGYLLQETASPFRPRAYRERMLSGAAHLSRLFGSRRSASPIRRRGKTRFSRQRIACSCRSFGGL